MLYRNEGIRKKIVFNEMQPDLRGRVLLGHLLVSAEADFGGV